MLSDLPGNWIQLTHPEGQPYFYTYHPMLEMVCRAMEGILTSSITIAIENHHGNMDRRSRPFRASRKIYRNYLRICSVEKHCLP